MPRNGTGQYSAPTNSWNPAINGVPATAADWQAVLNDIVSALTQSVSRDGQTAMTGNLPMAGNKVTGLGNATATGDALTFAQLFSQGQQQDIASAATTDIGAPLTTLLNVTGTATITSFGTNYNGPRFLRFAGVCTLINSATLVLPGGANITTAAGDSCIAVPLGNPATGWRVAAFAHAAGAFLPDDSVTFPKLQNIATGTILGRSTAGTGDVEALTGAQAQSLQPIQQTRVDIPSAATVNLTTGAANTDHVNVTGTTTITGFTVAAGRLVFVRFAGALTLTNNASIVTQTGANILTQAGDTCVLRATAANVVEVVAYVPAVLNQQTNRSMVRVSGANGYGSTNTVIRRFTTVHANVGSDITYADSATLGASFTINTPGMYAISYTDSFTTASDIGVSLNSTQLTTSISAINAADRIAEATAASADFRAAVAVTSSLAAGSVIRPHCSGFATNLVANTQLTITRVA